MKRSLMLAAAASLIATPAAFPTGAVAQRYGNGWRGDQDGDWDPHEHYREHERRHLTESDRVYRGRDGRYYCKRSNGTTGLVLGAVGGGLIGNALGGSTLGTLLGAGGGALLGKNLDEHHDQDQNRRTGYVCD